MAAECTATTPFGGLFRLPAVPCIHSRPLEDSRRERPVRRRRASLTPCALATLAASHDRGCRGRARRRGFLLWGPVGLGAGPLFVGEFDTVGGGDAGSAAVGMLLAVHNSSHDPAIIDSIRLIGRTRYPGPHVIRREAWSVANCIGAWPVPAGAQSFVAKECRGKGLGPLIGHAFGFTKPVSPGYGAAFEISPTEAGSCWVLTDVVIHYHVGTQHYSTTDPADVAVCAGKGQSRLITAAMNAAESAEPR